MSQQISSLCSLFWVISKFAILFNCYDHFVQIFLLCTNLSLTTDYKLIRLRFCSAVGAPTWHIRKVSWLLKSYSTAGCWSLRGPRSSTTENLCPAATSLPLQHFIVLRNNYFSPASCEHKNNQCKIVWRFHQISRSSPRCDGKHHMARKLTEIDRN